MRGQWSNDSGNQQMSTSPQPVAASFRSPSSSVNAIKRKSLRQRVYRPLPLSIPARTSSSLMFSVQMSASSNMLEAKASFVILLPHLAVSLDQSTSADVLASSSVVSGICAVVVWEAWSPYSSTNYRFRKPLFLARLKLLCEAGCVLRN